MAYEYEDIVAAYASVGVGPGKLIYLTSDMGPFIDYKDRRRETILRAHLDAVRDLLGNTGTLIVPSASMYLCNTNIPFNRDTTPSRGVGALSEFVRCQPGVIRSSHPFVSYCGFGPLAERVLLDTSRHAFGRHSPDGRMIELDGWAVSTGVHPRLSSSTVHHAEFVMGVPYRYTKEYMHPIESKGSITAEPYYQHVWYRDSDIQRAGNTHILEAFEEKYVMRTQCLGRGEIYGYGMRDFYEHITLMMKDDIYTWCLRPPVTRPWQI